MGGWDENGWETRTKHKKEYEGASKKQKKQK